MSSGLIANKFRELCIKFAVYQYEVPSPDWLDPFSSWLVGKVNNQRDQYEVMENLVRLIKTGNPIRDVSDAIKATEEFLKK